MKRKTFIKSSLVGLTSLALSQNLNSIQAAGANNNRTLIHINLAGGPDMRHLLPPAFSNVNDSYGQLFWKSRAASFEVETDDASLSNLWSQFTPITSNNVNFGVHPQASWLADSFKKGNVAILNNIVGATDRSHSHASIVWETGNHHAKTKALDLPGWGGKLATFNNKNCLSVTRKVRQFCFGPDPKNEEHHNNKNIVHAPDTRNISLYKPTNLITDPASKDRRSILSRALSSYYKSLDKKVSVDAPSRLFIEHEKNLRIFGDQIDARLASNGIPQDLKDLYEGSNPLSESSFGKQCRSVYDAFICSDIINFSVVSMGIGGWDSHKNQNNSLNQKFESLFGSKGGLATLQKNLQQNMPDIYQNTTFMISGEFGRQLKSNGDNGTDHGRGNSIILIGPSVKGGLYGDMFSNSEIDRFEKQGSDIVGKTSMQHPFARICDWVASGSSPSIFPDLSQQDLESGVDFSGLFV